MRVGNKKEETKHGNRSDDNRNRSNAKARVGKKEEAREARKGVN